MLNQNSRKGFIVSSAVYFVVFLLFVQPADFKPVLKGSFIQLFDLNADGQVDIENEIGTYYENILEKLKIANINITKDSDGIELSDFRKFLKTAEAKFVDDQLVTDSDANGDGRLNLGEQENFVKNFALKVLDTNHDGLVSGNESERYDAKETVVQFKKFDTNHDGKLSVGELDAMVEGMIVPMRAMIAKLLPPLEDLPLEKAKQVLGRKFGLKPEQVEAADMNKDGKLSFQDEFMPNYGLSLDVAKEMFTSATSPLGALIDAKMVEKADKDGNGFLNYMEMINLLTVDAALKLGDQDKDGFLNEEEFLDGFTELQALFVKNMH